MRPVPACAVLALLAIAGCTRGGPDAGTVFRDCPDCPELVVVPPGRFRMGAAGGEEGRPEGPVREVRIRSAFAAAVTEVTQEQFAAFVVATGREMPGGCRVWDGADWQYPADAGWTNPGYGRVPFSDEPVACVSWLDARDYAAWLAQRTGKPYRLLSEAEWEYVARAGTTGDFPWPDGDPAAPCVAGNVYDAAGVRANNFDWEPFDCDDGYGQASPAGSFAANAFGLKDVLGNVWEWTADCYVAPYPAGPADERPVQAAGECPRRTVRGGSWITRPGRQRVSFRGRDPEDARFSFFGIRVARDLR
ncbi:MAG: formylglycine-generating enzyme family protein [Chromatiales bacterium]|nr:formylglycine-generating enzyme family protein [Chromatiales bacterium]